MILIGQGWIIPKIYRDALCRVLGEDEAKKEFLMEPVFNIYKSDERYYSNYSDGYSWQEVSSEDVYAIDLAVKVNFEECYDDSGSLSIA